MDPEDVLLNVEERDKWRQRLDRLMVTLAETRRQRERLMSRLRRIKQELARLSDFSDAHLRDLPRVSSVLPLHATRDNRQSPR
ncbi:MAG: hypothetical protein WCA77_03220 [Thermoplasmata archaeon]